MQDTLTRGLADGIAALTGRDMLRVVELTEAGIVLWELRRDVAGTPRCRFWPAIPWPMLYNDGVPVVDGLRRVIGDGNERSLLFCSSADGPFASRAFSHLRAIYPAAPAFRCTASLERLLRQAMAASPLTNWYELVVLDKIPSGELLLIGHPLFPPTARCGDRKPLTIRSEPSDENGTVFAVTTAEHRLFRLVSAQSVKLSPGRHELTAELRRPGLVRFHGLPGRLEYEQRSWRELVATVPRRLHPAERVHLICLVEVSGTGSQVLARLHWIEKLVEDVARSARGQVAVSLISYGPHSIDRNGLEVAATFWAWSDSSPVSLSALSQLRAQVPVEGGYSRAAQLECVLTEVADRLTGREGRPFLIAAGSRPAFPRRVDPVSEIIPCPRGRDWRQAMERLRHQQGITFGAIYDANPGEEIWGELGRDAVTPIAPVDPRGFAARLGLLSPEAQYLPFPLAVREGDRAW